MNTDFRIMKHNLESLCHRATFLGAGRQRTVSSMIHSNQPMKTKLLAMLTLVLCAGGLRLAAAPGNSALAERILQQTAAYYQDLKSFEGTNTITDESPSLRYGGKMTSQKWFVFVRPNKFIIYSKSTNDSRLFCDGTKFWEYRPYYSNSYTEEPAPFHFEDAITNWVGGELLHVMLHTNRYSYLMSGCNWGMVGLQYVGEERVSGITCHHLLMEEAGSRTADWCVAKGRSPFIVKCVLRSPNQDSTNGFWVHTEIISGWQANRAFPERQFTFVPPAGALYHPPGLDDIETAMDSPTGAIRVRFYSRADLLKYINRLQCIALQGVLTNNPALTTNDIVFAGLDGVDIDKTNPVIARFELPGTAEKNVMTNGTTQTRVQAVKVLMSPDGLIQWITNGVTISFDSPAKPNPKSP